MRPAALSLLIAVALGLPVAGCGGGDDPKTTTPATTSPPSPQGPSPSAGQLPPAFTKCMRDRGYEITSPDQIHSAPLQVLQACFGELHQGQ
jgi:hypothetical protein